MEKFLNECIILSMMDSLYTAASALNASSQVADVTANNVANANTPSFRSRLSSLSELSGGGVKFSSSRLSNNLAPLIPTSYNRDFAIFSEESELRAAYSDAFHSFATDAFGNLREPNGDILFTGTGGNVRVDGEGFIYKNGVVKGQVLPANSYEPTGATILQGYMVGSNTDIARETVNSMLNTSYFKANANTIMNTDRMIGTLLSISA